MSFLRFHNERNHLARAIMLFLLLLPASFSL